MLLMSAVNLDADTFLIDNHCESLAKNFAGEVNIYTSRCRITGFLNLEWLANLSYQKMDHRLIFFIYYLIEPSKHLIVANAC